jgi:hypothetical protein
MSCERLAIEITESEPEQNSQIAARDNVVAMDILNTYGTSISVLRIGFDADKNPAAASRRSATRP